MVVVRPAQQVHGQVSDGCHILRPGAGSQSAKVLVEDNVEHPVQPVLDVPVAPHGVGEQLGVERHGGQIVVPFKATGAVALDLGLTTAMAQAREARLAREATGCGQPSDFVADQVTAQFDAAVIAVGCLEAAVDCGGRVSSCRLG